MLTKQMVLVERQMRVLHMIQAVAEVCEKPFKHSPLDFIRPWTMGKVTSPAKYQLNDTQSTMLLKKTD